MMHGLYNDRFSRQWSLLLIYNVYRLMNILVLFGLFWMNAGLRANKNLYCGSLFIYFLLGLFFLYTCLARVFKFKSQVLWSGTIDTIVLVLFIYAMGYLQTGLGLLLSVPIAMLSILVPGRLSIFFAAVATCMLLTMSIFQYRYNDQQNIITFFSTGMYGAFFFATALTAWYFVHWVRMSERLALQRGRELINMQRLNEYIVERLQYGVIYIDVDKTIKLMNHAARQFFQCEPINRPLTELSAELSEKYSQFLAKSTQGGLTPTQVILDKPYLNVHFIPTSTTIHPAVLVILDDMAVIAQQVQQLKLASLGRFSANIAHELRNPLGIISHAGQLLEEGGRLTAEDVRLNELIINNCHRMNAVIQNVLQVSRRQQARQQSFDLTHFLKQFKHEFCLINVCDMVLHVPLNKAKTIVFDKGHLEQILVILSDNAMQHGQDTQGEVHITISVKHEGQHLLLTFSDTGAGIASDLRDDVFQPFFSTTSLGNGMGLFIAKDLCEINQTRLSLMEVTQGCCFSILFNLNHEMQR